MDSAAKALGCSRDAMVRNHWFFAEGDGKPAASSASSSYGSGPEVTWYALYLALRLDAVRWAAVAAAVPSMLGIALTHQLIVVTDLVNIESLTEVGALLS